MAFLDLFRRSKPVATSTATIPGIHTVSEQQLATVNKDLFVDESQPELKDPPKVNVNPLEVFLDQNFEWQGYNDGYGHPETEYLDSKLRLLHAEFRLAVDKCLDQRRAEVGELRLHLIRTAGISDRMEAQLKEKIRQLETIVHELDVQKILSIESDGLVAPAVTAYRLGFVKGLERYQQEKLLAGSTGLFNL